MPSWRDNLRRCTWRGIECLYDSARISRGRRLVVTEYPERDDPDIEDLGRKARTYPIELYLLASELGDAFWTTRDRLVEALEAEGVGTLVHPYHGALQLRAQDIDESYNSREGGMVRFSCTFVAGEQPSRPTRAVDTQDVLRESADGLQTNAEQVFLEQWRTVGFSEFVRDAAGRVLRAASDATGLPLEDALGIGGTIIDRITNAPAVIEWLQSARARLASYGLPRIRQARSFGAELPPVKRARPDLALTPSQAQQADNQQAVVDAVQATTLAAAVDVVSQTVFDSVDEAIDTRDELLEQIDTLALTAPDRVFNALVSLRGALVEDIRARGAGLPNVRTITPTTTEPALVIAHRLYGDAARAADIVARNRIEHPGFVPGGQPIEVLTDAE